MKMFKNESDNFDENDTRGWISQILESKELGVWVIDKINYSTILDYLSKKP
jgi:hypothetical protein